MPLSYCALQDVQRVFSVAGVNLHVDDDPSIYPEVIAEASRQVDLFVLPFYSEQSLASSHWTRYATAVVTAYLLATRRGNPPPQGIRLRYEEYTEKLERIATGDLRIPGTLRRTTDAPTLSMPRIRLDPFPRTVIERRRGPQREQPTDYAQRADVLEWFQDYQI